MASTRITELPEIDSAQLQNDVAGNLCAQTTFIPCVENGVTKKIRLSDLSVYRSAGTVKQVSPGSSMSIETNVQTGISVASFTLPGAIFVYCGANTPDGYLFCNGSPVSRATYPNLFSAIGTTYGAGDGRTTFNLPDLRGRAAVGHESMGAESFSGRLTNSRPGNINATLLGASGGAETHTLTAQETGLNSHEHSHDVNVSWGGGSENGNKCNGGDGGESGRWPGSSFLLDWNYTITNDPASDLSALPHPNLPPLVFLNYIIKY